MKLLTVLLLSLLSSMPGKMSQWIEDTFAKGQTPPFSFVYDGKASDRTITRWKHDIVREETQDKDIVRYVVTYSDPSARLKVECAVTGYEDLAAVDWVLRFTNTSSRKSPVISDVRALDYRMMSSSSGPFTNLRLQGSLASKEDFMPIVDTLADSGSLRFAPRHGRSSDWDVCPYFNTMASDGTGIVTAIGWTGSWFEEMDCSGRSLRLSAGMQVLETFLYPGETIRTPLVTMLFWEGGDMMAGCNRFRRHMLAHNMRRTNGQTASVPMLASIAKASLKPCAEQVCLNEWQAVANVHNFEQFGIHPDVYWLDAGWYTTDGITNRSHNWENTAGIWRPDPARFPNGFRPIADAAHAYGSRLMVWFEPERACKGTYIAEEHPEWLLWRGGDDNYAMYNLGIPEALEWMCRYIGDFIEDSGIDWYRQDNCFRNLRPYWDENDEPGRKGITEIRCIEGLYAFWDYLLDRFPEMLIDNCASGGRRLDIEMYRRSVPLWRTDYSGKGNHLDNCAGRQGHTYGLSLFLPVHGTNIKLLDDYSFYSSLAATSSLGTAMVNNKDATMDQVYRRISQYKALQPYFYEDYYPLTGLCNRTGKKDWLAYQLHRPSDGTGLVMAFRHEDSPVGKRSVQLRNLDPESMYLIIDEETGTSSRHIGKELMEGLEIQIEKTPGAVLLRYWPELTAEDNN